VTGHEIAAQQALEWCRKRPSLGWMRICDCKDYEPENFYHAYIALGGIFVGVKQAHKKGYDWIWRDGFMMIIRPKSAKKGRAP
jgi:hypothetical protein